MNDSIRASLLDDNTEFTLAEICTVCSVPEQLVVEIVAEGIVEPIGAERAHWRFTGIAVARIRRVIRLQKEFEVNLPGAALALDLL
jgi:chaperone modulatory protein CbpM